MFLACHFAERYLLLVWYYGFSRVHKEGLHFTYMPSSNSIEDYVVSNGDHISKTDGFLSLPMAIVVWFLLILFGHLVIRHFSRLRNEAVYRKNLKKIYDAKS